ncbi:MAG: tRNA pseudouridine(55) synthase TruB [Clostridia bacterium]|nr:tRNA pseudouridine(55) synthase TruB [Clostridia bacterium]
MCGLLLINKPEGITSFGAVAKIRKITGEKRVGHTGTLDPMASGVLPVLLGRATKLCDYVMCADKSYVAKIRLGVATDSLDITGNVTESKAVSVTDAEIDAVLSGFRGEISQIPPMFNAVKRDGVRLYELARKGKSLDIPARRVNVFSVKRISDIDENCEFGISCTVSKGTYIRSLCRDIGEALGVPAALSALCRTKTAGFDISQCVPLESLSEENAKDYILPACRAVADYRAVEVTRPQAFRFSNGGSLAFDRLPCGDFSDGEIVRVNYENVFLGLAMADTGCGELKFRCIINGLKGD